MPRNSCCLGDPVFDLVYNVPFAVVAEQDVGESFDWLLPVWPPLTSHVHTGGCVPISPEDLQELKDRAAGAAVHSSAGGSAANVSRGLAQLQAAAARLQQDHVQPQYTVCFAGMVGNDQAGRYGHCTAVLAAVRTRLAPGLLQCLQRLPGGIAGQPGAPTAGLQHFRRSDSLLPLPGHSRRRAHHAHLPGGCHGARERAAAACRLGRRPPAPAL